MHFGLYCVLFNLLARKRCVVSYVHFPILEVFCMPFELHYSLHLEENMDHIFRLSRRDFPSIAFYIRYTSLDLKDFHLTFNSTSFFCYDFNNN